MLVSVFGTSTPYGFWGFSAVRHVMQVLYGDHHHIHCLTIEDLRQGFAARDGKPVVFTSDCPDAEVAELFLDFDAPIIAFLDEPEDAVAFAMESRKLDAKQALSFSSYCFCSLNEILLAPATHCFPSRHLTDDVRDIFEKLLFVLAGAAGRDALEDVMHRATGDARPEHFSTVADQVARDCANITLPAETFSEQPIEIQNLIMTTCQAYRPIFDRKGLTRVEWPRDLFFTCNERNAEPGLIELTGPARFLIWGPYLHLPVGDWIARVEFEVAENVSGNRLEADIFDGQSILADAMVELPLTGVYSFEMAFRVHDPRQEIEVRGVLMKGAIEGKFGLRTISSRRAERVIERASLVVQYSASTEV